uniref:Surface glycoprotein n=1 Tax=Trypanosoma brucei TaxID=5691 RepID=Q26810_9TRYP|nr:surface glycoprotein [Trypanosoma brucei]prf//1909283C major surface antigen:ISOTYPE=1.13 [Trypanosoma brucei]
MTKRPTNLNGAMLCSLLLLAVSPPHVQPASQSPLDKSLWQGICKATAELNKVPGAMTNELTQILHRAKTMRRGELKAQIFGLRHAGTPSANKAAVMAAYFSRRYKQIIEALETQGIEKAIDAAAKAAYLQGRIDDPLHLLAAVENTNNLCLSMTGAEGNKPVKTEGKLGDVDCPLSAPSAKNKAAELSGITEAGFTMLKTDVTSGNAKQVASGAKKCNLLSSVNTQGFGETQAAISTDHEILGGYITIKNTNTEIDVTAHNKAHTVESGKHESWTVAHAAIMVSPKHTTSPYANETGEIHSRPDMTKVLQAVYSAKPPISGTDLENKVIEIFQGKEEKKLQDYEDAVNQVTIPAGVAGLETDQTLAAVNDEDKLIAIRAFYEQQVSAAYGKMVATIAEASNKQTATAPADCGKKLKKVDCKESDGCKWNSTDKSEGDFCKAKGEDEQKAQGAGTGDGAAGEQKKEDKCKDKKKDDCKSPDCKWEGETCKDSSFLLNKKFALTVVSAAFAALLF